jgi:hypothetical protein
VQNGKTEYKSLTVCADATAEEFMDIYLDDDGRPTWDTMIVQHEVLEYGDFSQRQQVVRWIRKFPFSFISGGLQGRINCLSCQQLDAFVVPLNKSTALQIANMSSESVYSGLEMPCTELLRFEAL